MPQIDGSIPASVNAPKFDPLATIGNLTALQQTLLQNRLLGQQVSGKEAFGRAVQAATGQNGEVDTQAALKRLSTDPGAALMVPEAAQQLQTLRGLQAQTQAALAAVPKAQVEAFVANAAPVEGVVRGLVQNAGNAPLTKDYVTGALHRDLMEGGLLKTPEAQQLYAAAVSQLTDDPAHNLDALRSIGVRLGGPVEQYLGTIQTQNTGPALVQTQTPQLGGAMQVRGALATGLTPGEAATPTPVLVPNASGGATPATVPLSTYGEMAKTGPVPTAPALTPGGLTPSQASELVPVKGEDGTEYLVPRGTLVGGGASGAGSAPAPRNGRYPGGPSGAVAVSGLPPGQAETLQASAKAYQDDVAAVPNLRRAITSFDQARSALAQAPTGPYSDVFQNLRGLGETLGIPLTAKVKNDAEAFAEANKWLTSALTQEASRLGLGTDQARALQAEAQPSTHTIHDAAVKMLPVIQGLKAMELAAPVIAQAQGVTPQQYSSWRASWANSVDPLAFSAAGQTRAERSVMTAKMSDAQRAKYAAGVRAAVAAGLFSASDLAR